VAIAATQWASGERRTAFPSVSLHPDYRGKRADARQELTGSQ